MGSDLVNRPECLGTESVAVRPEAKTWTSNSLSDCFQYGSHSTPSCSSSHRLAATRAYTDASKSNRARQNLPDNSSTIGLRDMPEELLRAELRCRPSERTYPMAPTPQKEVRIELVRLCGRIPIINIDLRHWMVVPDREDSRWRARRNRRKQIVSRYHLSLPNPRRYWRRRGPPRCQML